MTNFEYFTDRFKGKVTCGDDFRNLFWEVFSTFVKRFPTNDIAALWTSGDPRKMFDALIRFVNQTDRMESLEFEVGDLVRVLPSYAKETGKLGAVTGVNYSGLCVVGIETEDGVALQVDGRYLEKTRLPKAIVDVAMSAVKAKMAEKCPMKDGAPCLA